jgi:serine/threonine-protein kinase
MGQPSSPASDRYALAVVAFQLLTGEKPFPAENFAAQARAHVEDEPPRASERDPDLPPAVDEVLARGMAKAPEDRWPTAGAFVEALGAALTGSAPPQPEAAAVAAPVEPTHVMAGPAPRPPRATPPARPSVATAAPRRRWGARVLIAMGALLVAAAALVAVLTSSGPDAGSENTARQQQPEATATREPTVTPDEPEATATATPTEEPAAATPEPTPEAQEEPAPAGESELGDDPVTLQARAFELNNAGDSQAALPYAERAVALCEGSTAVSPCAYALFEYARALRLTGDPERAIAALRERRQRFPADQPQAVNAELRLARQAARGK